MLKFMNEEDEKAFEEVCIQMMKCDCYHRAFAYIVSFDDVLKEHIQDNCIKRNAL